MAKRRVNKYPVAFRQMAVERMKNCPNVSRVGAGVGSGPHGAVPLEEPERTRKMGQGEQRILLCGSFGKRFAI